MIALFQGNLQQTRVRPAVELLILFTKTCLHRFESHRARFEIAHSSVYQASRDDSGLLNGRVWLDATGFVQFSSPQERVLCGVSLVEIELGIRQLRTRTEETWLGKGV